MPHDRHKWLRRIKGVELEHTVMRLAAGQLLASARRNPTILAGEFTFGNIGHASARLEGTYIIRLFAEFETGLRLYWPTARGTDPPSRTRDLLDGIAATRRTRHEHLLKAHDVRDYRNTLVHEMEEETTPIPIAEARGNLCRYFSFLPPKW